MEAPDKRQLMGWGSTCAQAHARLLLGVCADGVGIHLRVCACTVSDISWVKLVTRVHSTTSPGWGWGWDGRDSAVVGRLHVRGRAQTFTRQYKRRKPRTHTSALCLVGGKGAMRDPTWRKGQRSNSKGATSNLARREPQVVPLQGSHERRELEVQMLLCPLLVAVQGQVRPSHGCV